MLRSCEKSYLNWSTRREPMWRWVRLLTLSFSGGGGVILLILFMTIFLSPFLFQQHLNNLLENYLEPLKRETFLSNAEITALFGNIQEIVTFQRQFLQNLEEALEIEPDFHRFDHSSQFKVSAAIQQNWNEKKKLKWLLLLSSMQNVLFAIGSAFLYYVNHFKLYSSFCASHSKAQKVLHPSKSESSCPVVSECAYSFTFNSFCPHRWRQSSITGIFAIEKSTSRAQQHSRVISDKANSTNLEVSTSPPPAQESYRSILWRAYASGWSIEGHGKGRWAHQRDATHSRGVRCHIRSLVPTASKVVQAADRYESRWAARWRSPTTRIDGCDVWQKNMQNSFFVISHPFWLSSTHFSALFLSLYLPFSSHDMNSWKLWTNLKIQSLV